MAEDEGAVESITLKDEASQTNAPPESLDPDRLEMARELETTGHSTEKCYEILTLFKDDLDKTLNWLLTHTPAQPQPELPSKEEYEELS